MEWTYLEENQYRKEISGDNMSDPCNLKVKEHLVLGTTRKHCKVTFKSKCWRIGCHAAHNSHSHSVSSSVQFQLIRSWQRFHYKRMNRDKSSDQQQEAFWVTFILLIKWDAAITFHLELTTSLTFLPSFDLKPKCSWKNLLQNPMRKTVYTMLRIPQKLRSVEFTVFCHFGVE